MIDSFTSVVFTERKPARAAYQVAALPKVTLNPLYPDFQAQLN